MSERRERRLIIPFFLRNRGCPHRCVFCNERAISGNAAPVTEDGLRETVSAYLAGSAGKYDRAEIAFYGGSFTGMPREDQLELLRVSAALIAEGAVRGIRIATRPDDVDGPWLDTLACMGVRAVEIGAQSMDDEVLRRSERGHTAQDVNGAVGTLKEKGFETGVHLMVGLPGDSRAIFETTVEKVIRLRPDMVRIHPALVFRETELARLYERREYLPLSLEEAVSRCRTALVNFTKAGIRVIRLGLQATGEMGKQGCILAGPWHPSFRSLVEAELFRDMASELMARAGAGRGEPVFHVAPADLSSFNGPGGGNRSFLESRLGGRPIAARPDPAIPRGTLRLRHGLREYRTSIAEVASLV